jgi:hypothetical protein
MTDTMSKATGLDSTAAFRKKAAGCHWDKSFGAQATAETPGRSSSSDGVLIALRSDSCSGGSV